MGIAPRLRSIAALAAVLLVACTGTSSSTNSAAVAASDAVSFKTADGVDLSGRIFGPANATAGVVLAHTLSGDQTKWFGFADRLAGQGFRVLTFDFRGYCPTAALLVASADGEGIPALVLSAPQVLYGLEVGSDVLQTVTGAKLYIAGLGDPAGAAAAADAMAALGPQPVREEIVTADEHGTALLNSTSGEQVQELMEQWFGRYLAQRPTPSEAA
ncbi:MAG: hypothetical protein JF623_06375 [Acidobacteria bacterium]|nr:hypothetical protein [Acidobacteriota bacterium]